MRRATHIGIVLLGVYFVLNGFAQFGSVLAQTSVDTLDSSHRGSLLLRASTSWPFLVFYSVPGLVTILLAAPLARRLEPDADAQLEPVSHRTWVTVGITLIGVFLAVGGLSNVLSITFSVLSLLWSESSLTPDFLLPGFIAGATRLALGVCIAAMAFRISRWLPQAA